MGGTTVECLPRTARARGSLSACLHARNPDHFRDAPQRAHDLREVQAVGHLQREVHVGVGRRRRPGRPRRSGCSSPRSAISAATLASTPRWFATTSLMLTSNGLRVSGSHSTSSTRSGSGRVLPITGQSCVWMTMPWPLLMTPMIGSPGNRLAALRELHRHAFGAADDDRAGRRRSRAAPATPSDSSCRATTAARRLPSPMSASRCWRDFALDSFRSCSHCASLISARLGLERRQRLVEQPLAELHRLLEVHRLQEVPDVRARLRRSRRS